MNVSRVGLVAAAAVAIAGGAAAPSAAAEEDLTLEWTLLASDPEAEPELTAKCDEAADVCQGTYRQYAKRHRRVWELGDGTERYGQITETCEIATRIQLETNAAVDRLVAVSGVSGEICTWRLDVDGGTLVGQSWSVSEVSRIDDRNVRIASTATLEAVGGNGVFAGTVGEGTFSGEELIDLFASDGDEYKSRQVRTAPRRTSLRLHVKAGDARVRVTSSRALDAKEDDALRVLTVPNASCSATATKRGRRVAFPTARDRDRDGQITLAPSLRRKLGYGTWRVTIRCGYGAKPVAARSTIVLR